MEWQTRYFEGVVSLARVRSSRIVLTIRKQTSSQFGLKFFFFFFFFFFSLMRCDRIDLILIVNGKLI